MRTKVVRNSIGNILWRRSSFSPEDYVAHMKEFGHIGGYEYAQMVDFNASKNDPDGSVLESCKKSVLDNIECYLTRSGRQRVSKSRDPLKRVGVSNNQIKELGL